MAKHPPIDYGDYLKLDKLLGSQSPRSAELGQEAHDEMLFIIVHQTYELWFKQILHEIDSILRGFQGEYIDEKNIGKAVGRLRRVTKIQELMLQQLSVLETMTPLDFLEFRDYLIPASGFQSIQFRLLENKLGLRRKQRLNYNKSPYDNHLNPEEKKIVEESEASPSLFELVQDWLERTPFLEFGTFSFWKSYRQTVEALFQEDEEQIQNNPRLSEDDKVQQMVKLNQTKEHFNTLFESEKHNELINSGEKRLSFKATKAALLILLYRDEPILQMPFGLLDKLRDIDELLTAWRYRHALMAHRMIGTKIGTGGSSGSTYLKKSASAHKIFTDFVNLSTFLIPRSVLPELPENVQRELGFYYRGTKK